MKKPLVVHPLLFALFPFLFFYAHNIQEIHTLTIVQTLLLLAFILGITALAWFLLNLLLKNRAKAALATTMVIVAVLIYGSLFGMIQESGVFAARNSFLLPPVVALLAYCFHRIRRAQRDFQTTTQALNVAAAFLTIMNLFTIAHYEISATRMLASLADEAGPVVHAEADSMPDIYFIVLDEYGHPETMAEHFDYDNEPFIDHLEDLGFFVARDSTAQNERTVRCIASILNMEHTPEDEHRRVTHERINNNRVMDYLESLGYNIFYFGHFFELGRYEIDADIYVNYYEDDEQYSPFQVQVTHFLMNSPVTQPLQLQIADDDYVRYHRHSVRSTLRQLRETPAMQGPKFVFAHLMSPHVPFVFGPEGELVPPRHIYNYEDGRYYVGQYIYITEQITRVIDAILRESDTEPIIILQSDHGPRWVEGWEKILNAYYLPDGGEKAVHNAIPPVDTFPAIFNYYFDADLEPEVELPRTD